MRLRCTCNDHGVYKVYDNVSVIAVEQYKKNIVKCKLAQPVTCVRHCARNNFAFAVEVLEISKYLLTLSLLKPRRNSEGILKTHEMFIHGELCYTGNLFCKTC